MASASLINESAFGVASGSDAQSSDAPTAETELTGAELQYDAFGPRPTVVAGGLMGVVSWFL